MVTPLAVFEDEVPIDPAPEAGPPAGQLRLDDQLCFALYAAANEITRAYRPLLAELGLTYPQYLLMMALWERDDQTVTEIAQTLHLPGHGLLPVLGRLVAAGLITRRPDPADRRAIRLALTEAGAALEVAAAVAQQEVACRTRRTPEVLDGLRSQLHQLTGDLRRHQAAVTSAYPT